MSPEEREMLDQAERIQASGALGRSTVVRQLFEFLVTESVAGNAPKEVEIAMAVFGRRSGFNGGDDASVRVSVHRLRSKLDGYYRDHPGDTVRLAIPKGEYRVVSTPAASTADLGSPKTALHKRWTAPQLLVASACFLALCLAAWSAWNLTHQDNAAMAQRAAPWSDLNDNGRPLIIVTGDYYVFTDQDSATGAGRLVREYNINNRDDLDDYLMAHPEAVGRYEDVDLSYLPVSVAPALLQILPVLRERISKDGDMRVVVASKLTPEMLRENNIVYVGYLSGLGLLRDAVFAGSRYRVGETWDDLNDTQTARTFSSQEGGIDTQARQRDYGYLSTFEGPSGNRIIVIAGMRDVGLNQIAEAAVNPTALKGMAAGAGKTGAFEALYQADGLRRAGLSGQLVQSSPLQTRKIWAPSRGAIDYPLG